jgi:hypothetical protein
MVLSAMNELVDGNNRLLAATPEPEPLYISITHINGTQGAEWIDIMMARQSQVSAVTGTQPLQQSQVFVSGVSFVLGSWDNHVISLFHLSINNHNTLMINRLN